MWSARVSFHALVPGRVSIPSFARYSSGCRLGGFKQLQPHHYSFLPLMMASYSSEATPNKINIYTDYTVYKGKGAMSLKVIKPTWERVPTGSGIKISRDGVLLLEFALSRGDRDYDWENKENFALSALECAEILEAVEANTEKSFFHDPNKLSAGEGSVTKQLRLSPARETGWFFSLSVNYRGNPNSIRFDTIVSNAELRLIRNIMDFAIPRLLGFDEIFVGPPEIRQVAPYAELTLESDSSANQRNLPPF